MADVMLEERVTRLEDDAAAAWHVIAETNRRIAQSREETDYRIARSREETDRRMAESKAETERLMAESKAQTDQQIAESRKETDRRMAESKAEAERLMAESKAETERIIAESGKETDRRLTASAQRTERTLDRLSQEMCEFKKEMREHTAALKANADAMKKQWGELSNRLGTLAEDFVAPSVPRILGTLVKRLEAMDTLPPIDMSTVRLRRRHPKDRGRTQEYDVVAVCGKYVLINETKSSLTPEKIQAFVAVMTEVRDFFPEYADYHFIGAIAALDVDESLVRYGQRQGLIVLGLGDDMMEIRNAPDFRPTLF